MFKSPVWAVEKNVRGAWVIYGDIGLRQYYFYTKRQAIEKYKAECKRLCFYNK